MFGMGTGGSLRLLSPEIWGCQGPVRFASVLPFATALLSLYLRSGVPSASLPFPRTLKTAQVRFHSAPSNHDLASLLALTFFASLLSNHFHGPRSRSQFPVSAFASPVPCSLSPVPFFQDQALDRLVSPSSIHYCTSTDDLSTLSSSRGLTCF